MSFTDLFDSGEHKRNMGHFAAIVNLATVDGDLNPEEEKMLKRLAVKLDIDDSEIVEVLENPTKYPINPPSTTQKRLERLHDLFRMIFADHSIDDHERFLVEKYALRLGFSAEEASKIVKRSVEIFSGGVDFDDYIYLLNK
ncbi:MAG: TerB family tellurite resistance protein [Leeuwenhoekiella sp.]